MLVDKLISDEELNECYRKYGLCGECKQPKNNDWCRICNFQQNFNNWTSGNDDVDKFIQKAQLKANDEREVLEWIEYDRFKSIEYLAQGGFGTVYKAIWKDGPIYKWDFENNQWERGTFTYDDEDKPLKREKTEVALKCLHNSKDITDEFLKEVRYFNF